MTRNSPFVKTVLQAVVVIEEREGDSSVTDDCQTQLIKIRPPSRLPSSGSVLLLSSSYSNMFGRAGTYISAAEYEKPYDRSWLTPRPETRPRYPPHLGDMETTFLTFAVCRYILEAFVISV